MTKKDYIVIASVISEWAMPTRGQLARAFAARLREEHRAFDVGRFITACAVEETALHRTVERCIAEGSPVIVEVRPSITRDNVEQLLERRMIMANIGRGKWWEIRRNGATKRWKRSPEKFRIPIKAGLREYGYIDESHFGPDGILDPALFRLKGETK